MHRGIFSRPLGTLALLTVFAAAPAALGAQDAPDDQGMMDLAEVQWAEIVPGIEFGTLFGDWQAEAHGKLVRFDAGVVSPMHTHGAGYHAVVIAGTVINPYEGEEDPPRLEPGAYWATPAGAVHATGCVSEEPCLIYAHMDEAWDIEVVED